MQSTDVQKQMEGIKAWQQRVVEIQTSLLHKRDERIKQAKRSINETAKAIQDKQKMITSNINKEAVYKETSIRVNRGLESLERLIQVLREINMNDDLLTKAIHDPIMTSTIKETARRAVTSDFVKSVQKQIVMQTEFVNIAAHELRTPIMPILASVEILEAELGQENEWLVMIKRNALRLQRLTENILNLSKIESGSLALNKRLFDMNSLLSEIVKDSNLRLENKSVRLLLDTKNNVFVKADRDNITRVINNLLDNAIKFTDEGVISITSERIDSQVVVSISDSGPGIDPRLFPVLFTKFATMSNSGTGLGLYICKGIIEAHGGKIWAKNRDGRVGKGGATLAFSLPV